MNPFEMVVAIVFIVMVASVLKARVRQTAQGSPADDAEAARARDEVRQLKERIAVLERVITDQHSPSALDREIERLRDQR
jgi:uncharacterized protein YlxW (UPF0749 family)